MKFISDEKPLCPLGRQQIPLWGAQVRNMPVSVVLTSPCLVSRRKPREFCEDFAAGQGQQLAGQPEVSAFQSLSSWRPLCAPQVLVTCPVLGFSPSLPAPRAIAREGELPAMPLGTGSPEPEAFQRELGAPSPVHLLYICLRRVARLTAAVPALPSFMRVLFSPPFLLHAVAAAVCPCGPLRLPPPGLAVPNAPLPSSRVLLLTPRLVSQVPCSGGFLQRIPCRGCGSCGGEPEFWERAWVPRGLGLRQARLVPGVTPGKSAVGYRGEP